MSSNIVDFLSRLERRAEDCQPCDGCGDKGTWFEGLCPLCRQVARTASEDLVKESDLDRHRPSNTLMRAGVPRLLAEIEFKVPRDWPLDPRPPQLPLNEWKGERWSALLTGPTGTGKSMLAVNQLREHLLDEGGTGRFIRARRVPDIYFTGDSSSVDLLETVGLLVLDDLGRCHPGGSWQAIGELLTARYESQLSTIITSNLSLAEIGTYDAHAASRLKAGAVMKIGGRDRRRPTRAS